jgi:hypothetical protein
MTCAEFRAFRALPAKGVDEATDAEIVAYVRHRCVCE